MSTWIVMVKLSVNEAIRTFQILNHIENNKQVNLPIQLN